MSKKSNVKSFNLIKDFFIDKHELNKFSKLNISSKKKFLIEKSKRPIDAIKHQAKTVTVGATRIAKSQYCGRQDKLFFKKYRC